MRDTLALALDLAIAAGVASGYDQQYSSIFIPVMVWWCDGDVGDYLCYEGNDDFQKDNDVDYKDGDVVCKNDEKKVVVVIKMMIDDGVGYKNDDRWCWL